MTKTLRHLFTPHKTNNHRPRILHPMGMVVMVAFVLLSHSGIELLAQYHPQGFVLGFASNISNWDVLQQTNQQRIDNGLPALAMSEKLNVAAKAKAEDMFKEDYWAHISPSGVPPWTFIKNSGYNYTVAGENLARDFDTTGPMVSAWMASPTHRANIVHSQYRETGIAVVNGTLGGVETTLVVQMFGTPIQPHLAPISQSDPPQDLAVETLPAVEEIPAPEETLPSQEISLIPQSQTVLSESDMVSNEPVTFVSPLDIKKSAVVAVIGMIMAVLVIDELIIRNRQTVRFVGRNFAHISFLGLAMLVIWNVIQPGMIR